MRTPEHETRTMNPLRGVVFDLDGLMFNTEDLYTEVAEELLGRRGRSVTKDLLDRMMGRPGTVALRIMIDHHQLDATVDDLQRETAEIFPAILDRALQPMPGLLELLDQLEQAGRPKAIATSSRRRFALDILQRFDLADRFQFVLTCEDVRSGKPDPEVYLQAADRLQLPPGNLLVLEDSENGCRAAVAAGTFAVAVPGEHSRRHDFSGARFIASSLADARIFKVLELD
jgi:HAD superfamily hydrolase (TIGR01509 family)